MSSKRHKKQGISGTIDENVVFSNQAGTSRALCTGDWDGKRNHSWASVLATLPRGHRKIGLALNTSPVMSHHVLKTLFPCPNGILFKFLGANGNHPISMSRSNSLVDSLSAGPQRRLLLIVKQDNEPFGFEIQTYKLQHQNAYAMEMCTYVCKVHENSPSSCAGLKKGDMLTNINGISTEGFSHQQTVDLIRSSGNYLRIETVNGTNIRRTELEAKLMFLKQEFKEKWAELQTLSRKEQQLIHGTVNEAKVQEDLESLQQELFASQAKSPSCFLNKHRFSSGSSYVSRLSFMTDNSDESFGQLSVFDEDSGSEAFSRQSSIDDDCFHIKVNRPSAKKSSLSRHRTISMASTDSETMSPNWDTMSLSNIFGTLPRKSRKGSIRRNFLKFIPGLHRSVEEEESPV